MHLTIINQFNVDVFFQFNQDLYSTSNVPPIAASSSNASAGSHSPCSPIIPPNLTASNLTQSAASISTIPIGSLQRHLTKEEDLSVNRSDTEGNHAKFHLLWN
jgi:hypothetical protein